MRVELKKRSQTTGKYRKMMRKDADQIQSKIPVANVDGSLESAASFTRGGTPPAPDHDALERERATRIAAEQPRIIQWVELCGKLGGQLPPEDTTGGEHRIYYSFVAARYVKATIPGKHKGYGIALGSFTQGATPSEYLDRLALQDRIFNDDIRIEFVLRNDGFPIIVSSQPFISGTHPPSPRKRWMG